MFFIDILAGLFLTTSIFGVVDTPITLTKTADKPSVGAQLVVNKANASLNPENITDVVEETLDESEVVSSSDTQDIPNTSNLSNRSNAPEVPFYSQFADISSPDWQGKGCGVASLAMVVEYFTGDPVSVDRLLNRGLSEGAYITNAGWSHQGLVNLSRQWGLGGTPQGFGYLSGSQAFDELNKILKNGPIIASVYYKMEPGNPIPHLVVVNGVEGDTVYYNDPAEETAGKTISKGDFIKAWKKRIIKIRP